MRILSKILLVFVQGVLVLSAHFAHASTFGDSCSALPVFDDTTYLVNDTAYGFLQQNIDMKTYVNDGCKKGGSLFKFCIKNESSSPDFCTKVTLSVGDKTTVGAISSNPDIGGNPVLKDIALEVKAIDNEVCLVMPTSRGVLPLMCRNGEGDELVQPGESEVCRNLGQSCYDGRAKSQSLLSFSGLTIHCLRDTLNKVFYVGNECPRLQDDLVYSALQPFPAFQSAMKMAVRAALMLYVMVYGFRIAMNGEYAHVDKVAMFIIKFLLVTYFAVGLGQTSFVSGKEVSQNGMTGYALPVLVQLTNDFTEMVFMAGGSQGLCDFDVSKYDSGYEFYKIWDAIDCRIGYYLGMQLLYNMGTMLKSVGGTVADGATVGNPANLGDVGDEGIEALFAVGTLTFFPVMFGMFMAGQIVVVLMGLLFVIFFVSVLMYFMTAYLVCTVTLYVMAYISPIFITMALFDRTKAYFDSWLKIVVSCTLQPAVIGGFIAILLTVYDSAIYGTCEFQRYDYTIGEINFSTFELREPTVDVEKCQESLGYKLMKYYLGQGWEKKIVILFEIPKINDYLDIALSLIYVMIYVFIFYFFVKSVSEFAADLTGGPSVASVTVSPTAIIDKAIGLAQAAVSAAKAAIKAKTGDTQGAMEDAKEAKDKIKEDTTKNRGGASDKISTGGGGDDAMDKISTGGGDKGGGMGGGMSGGMGGKGGGMSGGMGGKGGDLGGGMGGKGGGLSGGGSKGGGMGGGMSGGGSMPSGGGG